jgi:hypothetical protein
MWFVHLLLDSILVTKMSRDTEMIFESL